MRDFVVRVCVCAYAYVYIYKHINKICVYIYTYIHAYHTYIHDAGLPYARVYVIVSLDMKLNHASMYPQSCGECGWIIKLTG